MSNLITDISMEINALRNKKPLVHCITNYVTVNDVANAVLAVGGSPIMADDINEAAEISAVSSALLINIGTLNERTVESMIQAGQSANKCGVPVIFDPVGAGASGFRNNTVDKILTEVNISVIKGNLSEILYIAGIKSSTKGVDASPADRNNNIAQVAKEVANKYKCVVAVTGATDIVTDGTLLAEINNGVKELSLVTGTGCMTGGLIGAFAGSGASCFESAVAGICAMGMAGEISAEQCLKNGTGSFHTGIIDALSQLSKEIFLKRSKIDEKKN